MLIGIALSLLPLGLGLGVLWGRFQHPVQPLYVDIYNGTASTLSELSIQPGKANLQKHIQVLQIRPRVTSLHRSQPRSGLGFNSETTLEHEKQLSICAGKGEAYPVRATLSNAGDIPRPIR